MDFRRFGRPVTACGSLDIGLRSLLAAGSRRLGAPKEMVLGCWVPGAWKLGYWRLGSWRLGGYQACRPRLGGLALIGVIAGWLVLVLGCVLTRSTLREVGGSSTCKIILKGSFSLPEL